MFNVIMLSVVAPENDTATLSLMTLSIMTHNIMTQRYDSQHSDTVVNATNTNDTLYNCIQHDKNIEMVLT
jgi:hypothetical protein